MWLSSSYTITFCTTAGQLDAVQNHGVARVGDTLNVRARVTKNYEHKGHKWVEIDALVLANETTPIARVTHIAIYRPRQLAEAA